MGGVDARVGTPQMLAEKLIRHRRISGPSRRQPAIA
jgi:hypothetical protein